MLAGGSRSGKTFLTVRKIIQRALKAPTSRHGIFRFRLGHVKSSIVQDTFPKVMRLAFPRVPYEINRSDLYASLPGGSEVWFGGLDDKERVEKILGNEYASIFLNECSQIPYASRNMAVTRLAQKVLDRATGEPLRLKMYYDENPPDKGHWTYKLFVTHQDPDSKQYLPDPENYAFMRINPADNRQNLSGDYIKTLESLPPRLRKRFLEGEFRDNAENALFSDEIIERWRNIDRDLPEMLRIVVAVDPSGADDTDNTDNDEIGIVVCGLGIDGNGYVLEDLTCKAGPATWGRVAVETYRRHAADRIVAEINYGGAMVGATIRAAAGAKPVPFRPVTATRGKVVRAEPISALMDAGKIRMAGLFTELEDELCGFTTMGYMGDRSPNRADAMIWGMSDLFPDMLRPPSDTPTQIQQVQRRGGPQAWMRTL
ncbi:MAG: phage terminase large subunit [Betaproteobacteria bacterium]|nr:phage terminase large subunit [Betaproteobacteria bacterium]